MSDQPDRVPSVLPPDYFRTPSSARVWNYWLGGKDYYPADQTAGDAAAQAYPQIRDIARNARQFLVRAVTYLAGPAGVSQFLDIGTGLPTEQNTHEVAQAVQPGARIVYADNDPVVLAHARALLTNTTTEGDTTYLQADVREPENIIEQASATLDFTQPVALMLLGILGHAASSFEQMHSITARLVAALPAGSYLVLQDGVDLEPGNQRAAGLRGYRLTTLEEFQRCFAGLELVEPGLVPINHWRPHFPDHANSQAPLPSYCGVARKPA